MFFNCALFGRTGLIASVLMLCACSDNAAEQSQSPQQNKTQINERLLERVPLEPMQYQRRFTFHSIIKGFRSYNETIFESGKLLKLNIKEGEVVTADQIVAEVYSPILAERLEQAKARLKQAEAQYSLDQESLQRIETLFQKKLVSQQSLDLAKRNFYTSNQTKAEASAGVSLAENEFADTSLKVKEAGVVAKVFKREGEFISPGESVFRLESIADQKVSFALPEKLAIKTEMGDQFEVVVPSLGKSVMATLIERSLPTQGGINLHTLTFKVNEASAELVGLRAELIYEMSESLAYKVDYRAIRYDATNSPYIIQGYGYETLYRAAITVLDMRNEYLIVSGEIYKSLPLVLGSDVSLPINLYTF